MDRWYRHYTLEGTERTAQGLVQRIVESPRLLDLAGNPLLLTMMAVIYKDRDLPNERWRLYERCAETLLEDWDLSKGIEDEDFKLAVAIRTAQKSEMLQRVAKHMLDHAQPGSELNAIAYGPLREILAGYLAAKYLRPAGEAEAIAVDILRHLMERTYVLAGVGERVFGFVHRTFMEYFAACYYLAEFNARKSDFTWLNEEIFAAHWQDPAWEEVLLLLIAMLHDQGTPIDDVVERVRRSVSGRYPYHLTFAARCLGEAGDLQDQRQGRDLLSSLAEAIARHGQKENPDAGEFTETALEAFATLAPLVNDVPPRIRNVIGLLREPSQRRQMHGRIAAWQMEYALRSRKERLEFALAALQDPEEAVRRGAIAVLEREWPGRPDIAPALADVVKGDLQARVRIAALESMQRSWRYAPSVLDAIESRIGRETGYTVVVRLIEYLASAWPGNPKAMHLVLRLSGSWRALEHPGYKRVVVATFAAVVRSWPSETDQLGHLLNIVVNLPAIYRAAVLGELARLTAAPIELLAVLNDRAVSDSNGDVRASILYGLADGSAMRGNYTAERLALLQDRAINDPYERARGIALRALAENWVLADDNACAKLVLDRAVNDPDKFARSMVLRALAEACGTSAGALTVIWDFLQDRAVNDPASYTRASILETLARTQGTRFIRPIRDFVWCRIADDPDPDVRAVLLAGIAGAWGQAIDPASWSLLRDRAENELDPSVRWKLFRSLLANPGRPDSSHYRDHVQALLRDRALNDPDDGTRAALIEALG